MRDFFAKLKDTTAAIALLLVIMITTLTLVSAVVMTTINISELTANYHVGESERVQSNIDSCVNDALLRIASSTSVSGNFTIIASTTACAYQISVASGGIKNVTSTATTTSSLGSWSRGVLLEVNASATPIVIESYKDKNE